MLRSLAYAAVLLITLWASTVWAEASSSITSPTNPLRTEPEIVPLALDTLGASPQWATDVVVGEAHSCALTSGKVLCWGDNTYGQLGDGTRKQRNAPVNVIGLPSGVTAIAAGPRYTCAAATPFAWCWGTLIRQSIDETWLTPQLIPFEADIVALTAGTRRSTPWQAIGHVCALTSDGDIYCWGSNDNGQLGNGTVGDTDQPQLVLGIDKGAIAVAAGNHHTCALVYDGVKCWGWNGQGQLGDGTGAQSRWSPVNVVGMEHNVIAIDVGGDFSCALTNQHKIWCWGSGLGIGSTPMQVDGINSYLAISVLDFQICAVRTNYKLYCNSFTEPILDLDEYSTGLEIGQGHSCFLTDIGGVKCWGGNDNGQLGMGTTHYQPAPVEPSALYTDVIDIATQVGTCVLRTNATVECFAPEGPVQITGLEEGVRAVNGQCAVTNNGALKCWRDSGNRAELILGLESGVVAVATASFYGSYHACALSDTGGVKCWGNSGAYGECGNGTIQCSDTPSDVVGLTDNVSAIATAEGVSCALMTDEKVKCWGDDLYSGQGTDICSVGGRGGEIKDYCDLTPVDIIGLPTQVQEIALGGDLCVLDTNGNVACKRGSSFTNVGATSIRVGQAHQCVLLDSGGVKCWGNNEYGQVGNGVLGGQIMTPVGVKGLDKGVTAISTAREYTCIVTASGGVRCWGYNGGGQLGINTGQTPVDVIGFGVVDVEHHHLPWLIRKDEED